MLLLASLKLIFRFSGNAILESKADKVRATFTAEIWLLQLCTEIPVQLAFRINAWK